MGPFDIRVFICSQLGLGPGDHEKYWDPSLNRTRIQALPGRDGAGMIFPLGLGTSARDDFPVGPGRSVQTGARDAIGDVHMTTPGRGQEIAQIMEKRSIYASAVITRIIKNEVFMFRWSRESK